MIVGKRRPGLRPREKNDCSASRLSHPNTAGPDLQVRKEGEVDVVSRQMVGDSAQRIGVSANTPSQYKRSLRYQPSSRFRPLVRKDDAPRLAEQFFLSAPEAAWSSFEDTPWQKGTLKSEPDLYAKIASIGASPSSILDYANRYGLLGPTVERWQADKMLWPEYLSEPGFDFSDGVSFCAEPAFRWLGLGSRLTHLITKMEKIGNEPKLRQAALLNWCNMNTERSLDYRVEWDSATGRVKGEFVASSLADMLNVQLVSALEADVRHRRCEQCQTFFPVHPGFGRPEKKYCSDVCRMRAYRIREASKAKGLA